MYQQQNKPAYIVNFMWALSPWVAAFHRLRSQGKAEPGSLVWILTIASLSTCFGTALRQGHTNVDPTLASKEAYIAGSTKQIEPQSLCLP